MITDIKRPVAFRVRDQVYSSVRSLIAYDRCKVGQKLPPSRELATQLKVSLPTVQAALQRLAKEGLVSCEVGRGTYVKRTIASPDEPKRKSVTLIGLLSDPPRPEHNATQPRATWTSGILFGMHQELATQGGALASITFDRERETLAAVERRLSDLGHSVSGLIFTPTHDTAELTAMADRLTLPWVMINQQSHMTTRNFVTADYYGGGFEVGKLFARLGRKRFLFLRTRSEVYSGRLKESGFSDGLSAGGLSPNQLEVLECDTIAAEHGFKAVAHWLANSPTPPDGIFTVGDLLAIGAMNACQARGLRVPDDVAVVGSTGIEAGEHSTPTLTTVAIPTASMGTEAIRMLFSLIGGRIKQAPGKILPVQLVQRGSTPALA